MEAALNLMRRISPKQSETALSALLALLPSHSSELLSQVDQPLQVFFFPSIFPLYKIDMMMIFFFSHLYHSFKFLFSLTCIGFRVEVNFGLYCLRCARNHGSRFVSSRESVKGFVLK